MVKLILFSTLSYGNEHDDPLYCKATSASTFVFIRQYSFQLVRQFLITAIEFLLWGQLILLYFMYEKDTVTTDKKYYEINAGKCAKP